ncbi:MAG: CBS domain-containing protein [Spirochaetes bacterium]|nr:CBS domain-containing protein [Spirochaetota bacterium]
METKFDKTVEILFELKVSDVMRKDIITIGPRDMMSNLKKILREHRISGLPVVDDGRLVGVISIEDLIRWLGSCGEDRPVEDIMAKDPICLYADQPLIHAVKKFDQHGFGRFPVLERESGRLVGIITRGVIIDGTLKKLEREYKEEEIRQYRASHFFGDISADQKKVSLRFKIAGKDFDNAGKASTTMKKNLKRLGIRPDIIQRIAIASYEAEMNVVIYTDGGTMLYTITEDKISLKVTDSGPGIEDIEKAMEPGFTTSESWVKELGFGAGMGLPNIKKCSDRMSLQSDVGTGTSLKIEIDIGDDNEAG